MELQPVAQQFLFENDVFAQAIGVDRRTFLLGHVAVFPA